jgi:hypothetical protein
MREIFLSEKNPSPLKYPTGNFNQRGQAKIIDI